MGNDVAVKQDSSTQGLVLDGDSIDQMQKVAVMMAEARVTVPKHLSGSPGDCLAVIMQAMQWKMNPFAVAQKTHLVNGILGYEAQLVNAVVSSTGTIKGRFHYEYNGEGDKMQCRVGAIPAGETEIQWGEWLAVASVTTKNSPLWKTNPKQQIGYLQVKNWARQYAPGAILGVYTPDELETIQPRDMGTAERVDRPTETAALPYYPSDKFEANFGQWLTGVQAGKVTVDGLLAKVGSAYQLTQDQLEQVEALRDAEPPLQGEVA